MNRWFRKKRPKRKIEFQTDLDDKYYDLLTGMDDPFGSSQMDSESELAANEPSVPAKSSTSAVTGGNRGRIQQVSPSISGLRASGPRPDSRPGGIVTRTSLVAGKKQHAEKSPHVLDLSS